MSTNPPNGWYSQRDEGWGGDRLGSESETAADCTIGKYGCAMTCGAMLNQMEISGDSVDVDPNTLNTWLTNNGGYQYQNGYAIIVWTKIADMDGSGGLIYKGPDDNEDNWTYLDSQLNSGNMVIVKVVNQYFPDGHWVLVVERNDVSEQPSSYKIYDPWPTEYTERTLQYYYNPSDGKTFLKSRAYSGIWRTGFNVHNSIQVVRYWGKTMCYDNDLYLGSTGPWTTPYDWDTEYREGDFRAAFRIKNTGTEPTFIEHLVLSIYDSEGNFIRYMKAVGSSSSKIDQNINLEAGDEYRFDEAWTSFTQNEIKKYNIVAEALIDGVWYKFRNKDYQSLGREEVGMTVTVTSFPLVVKKISSPAENGENIWEVKTSYYPDGTGKLEVSYELQNISSQTVSILELYLIVFQSGVSKIMSIPDSEDNIITNVSLEPGGSLSFPPPKPEQNSSSATDVSAQSQNQTAAASDMAYYNFSNSEGGIYDVIAKVNVDGQTVDIVSQDLNVVGYPVLTWVQISGWSVVSENSGTQYTCTAHYADGTTANVTGDTTWTLEGTTYASLNNSGYLTTYDIPSEQYCRIRASYGGMYDLFNVTIETSGSSLQAPYNLTASKGTYTDHIAISWSIAPGTDQVSIQRKKDNGSWLSLGWTDSLPSHTDNYADLYSVYYYKVRAHNTSTGDVSPESNEDSGFLKEPTADEKTPQNVTATNDSANFIQLSCDWMAGIDGWKVYRSESVDGAYSLIKDYDNNQGFIYNDYSAEPGIYYYYKLTSYGSFGESPPCSPVGGSKLLYIGGMSPTNGKAGDTVTITNSEYPPDYPFGICADQGFVYFGSTPAVVTSWSSDQVTVTVPGGSGTVSVTIASPMGIGSINSHTFSYNPPPTLTSIEITGQTEVDENSGAQYNCIANYDDGSTLNINGSALWSVDSPYAVINNSGYLTTTLVSADQSCILTSSFEGKSATYNITIKDIVFFTYTLTVQSTPDAGVPITVTPGDLEGNGDGTTNFTRTYNSGTNVTLTAPSSYNEKDFVKWVIDGQDNTNRSIQVLMENNRTVEVFYSDYNSDDDGDGYTEAQGDCRDDDETIHPGAEEIRGDGIDQDCNGEDLSCLEPDYLNQIEQKILSSGGGSEYYFGRPISMSGDYAIVGAFGDTDNGWNAGAAYILERSGYNWSEVAKLTASDGAAWDQFGYSVSISGDYAVVGAWGDEDNGEKSGSAYVFERINGVWTQVTKLIPNDGGEQDRFGWSVSISGNYIVIGAYGKSDSVSYSGAAYVFERINGVWTQVVKLIANDPSANYFGYAVSVSGDYAVSTALSSDSFGSVYVFKRENGVWTQTHKLNSNLPSDNFGETVIISNNRIVVGAYGSGDYKGSAYVFERNGETWTSTYLSVADGAYRDYFGASVAIYDDHIIIGAPGDDDHGETSGSVYIFEYDGDLWSQVSKLTASDSTANDNYGYFLATNGDYMLVGSYADDDNGTNSGSVYAYSLNCSVGPARYILTVQSTPETGIPITVNPNDKDGNGDGNTMFTRTYNSDTTVTLTAPSTYNGKNFVKWTIDGQDNTSSTIQVTMNTNRTAEAYYAEPMTIMVSSPNGGENWEAGSTYNVAWTSSGLTGNVTIDLYKGGVLDSNIGSHDVNSSPFPWTIDPNQEAGSDYTVKIYQGTVEDFSDNPFTISSQQIEEPEIKITHGNTEILDGGSFSFADTAIGNSVDETFIIENTGNSDLILSNLPITITGNNADQFSVIQQPTTPIIPGGTSTFIIRFFPSSQGTKTAEISIDNNDSDENPYDITLNGTGTENIIPTIERNALIALYESTNGNEWTDNSGWKDQPLHTDGFAMPGTEGTWYGITVENISGEKHVTRIELGFNNLNGDIPIELGNLSNLKVFDLGVNPSFNPNPIPGWITTTNLPQLEIIRLDSINLTGLIPIALGQFGNLISINLSNNSLEGNIPPELGSLLNLEELLLYNNQLTGDIPDELANLTKLKNLDLESNQLSDSFPDWVTNLTDLWNLNLGGCGLTGTIPQEIGNLTNLITLVLSNNQLTGTVPTEICQLTKLNYLNLSNNDLSGDILTTIVCLDNLQVLYLFSNEFTGSIPVELGNLSKLTNLYLGDNRFSGTLPSELSYLSNLKDLFLQSNMFIGEIPLTFTNLTDLEYLYIVYNGLYTEDEALRDFLIELDPDWETTQTVAPSDIIVTPLSCDSIELNWAPIIYTQDEGSYKVLYGTTSGGPYPDSVETADKTASSITVTGLVQSTNYYFIIQTCTEPHSQNKNTVCSEYSDELSDVTPLCPPSITVTSPNGGEIWEAGATQAITWSAINIEGNVIIEYSTDGGEPWQEIASTPVNDCSYNWTVPDSPSDNCLVRISSGTSDDSPSDTSDEVFSIVSPSSANITVISPNGSEIWEVGSIHEITWTSYGFAGEIKIEYSIDNRYSWTTIVTSTDNDGSYNWIVPNNPSENCFIRIRRSDSDEDISDVSNAAFSIVPASSPIVTVISPNGGECLTVGTLFTITWASSENFNDVKIEFSANNGTNWTDLIVSTPNDGSFEWIVPDSPSESCLIRISDTNGETSDVSDAVFSIVPPSNKTVTITSPNGGESWEVGSSQNITWTSTGTIENVIIEYSTDNGSSWRGVVLATPNDGSFEWTVPDTPSDECLVRISGNDGDEAPSDVSDSVFSIASASSLVLTAPNGEEIIHPGENYLIKWISNDQRIANIKLEYSPDNGTTYLPIADCIPNTGYYYWQVPYHISSNCLVRISNAEAMKPAQPTLLYDIKFRINVFAAPFINSEMFTIWLGDLLNVNEDMQHLVPNISLRRESNGDIYLQFDEFTAKIPEIASLSNQWHRLKILVNPDTQLESLWLDNTLIFENLPMKPGSIFIPAVSFSISAEATESFAGVEIDDFNVCIFDSIGRENRCIKLFSEDFETFKEGKLPGRNSGWRWTESNQQKADRSKYSGNIFVSLDSISRVKSLYLQTIGEIEPLAVKYFNIPQNFPFDTSDKPFEIKGLARFY
jgi:Leucine-rich repeat (LRR) protein